MNLMNLASDVHMDSGDVMVKLSKFCRLVGRDLPNFNHFSPKEYDLFRAYLDPLYLTDLVMRTSRRKYDKNKHYIDLVKFAKENKCDGMSTAQVRAGVPSHIGTVVGAQTVAAAMREAGYVSKMTTLDVEGRQGRRWFKAADDVSFI